MAGPMACQPYGRMGEWFFQLLLQVFRSPDRSLLCWDSDIYSGQSLMCYPKFCLVGFIGVEGMSTSNSTLPE